MEEPMFLNDKAILAGLDKSMLDRKNGSMLDCNFAVEYMLGHISRRRCDA